MRRVAELRRVGEREAEREQRVGPHRPHRLRALPARLAAADAQLAQAGGLEEAQLVGAELARRGRAAALVAQLDAEAPRGHDPLAHARAQGTHREAEQRAAHPEQA